MNKATDLVYLSTLSSKDKPWDNHKCNADKFKALYQGTEHDCYAVRISECSCRLVFAFQVDDNGICRLKLSAAHFCRCRNCPICQWRRSLMWRGKAFKILPKILEENPKARFIFLTLTVKNCPLDELRSTLDWMHSSWRKLVKRKEFAAVDGWIRAAEVTRGHDDTAHPHYHCLLMVKPSYFSHGYISQERWQQVWQNCLRVEYNPIVDVRAVRPKRGTQEGQEQLALMSAITETLKYSVKPSDVLKGGNQLTAVSTVLANKTWLVELTKQLHKTRAIATGGLFKQYLKALEDEPEDLIHVDEDGLNEPDQESPRVLFDWHETARRYAMEP